MWAYEKRLQYPIDIKTKDLKMAKYLVTQYGCPKIFKSTLYYA